MVVQWKQVKTAVCFLKTFYNWLASFWPLCQFLLPAFRCSLLVHVLCKLNRLTEALDLLEGVVNEAESDDRPQAAAKIAFPIETVMTLTKAVEATSDKVS